MYANITRGKTEDESISWQHIKCRKSSRIIFHATDACARVVGKNKTVFIFFFWTKGKYLYARAAQYQLDINLAFACECCDRVSVFSWKLSDLFQQREYIILLGVASYPFGFFITELEFAWCRDETPDDTYLREVCATKCVARSDGLEMIIQRICQGKNKFTRWTLQNGNFLCGNFTREYKKKKTD